MRTLIVISQMPLAKEAVNEAAALLPGAENVFGLDGTDRDALADRVNSICNIVHAGDELVVLADVLTSPAVMEVMRVLEKRSLLRRTLTVAGFNISMIMAALRFKDSVDTLEELSQTLVSEAKAGIQVQLLQPAGSAKE